jgi:hypothetical protein
VNIVIAVGQTLTLASLAVNGDTYNLVATGTDANTITLELTDGSGNVLASEELTAAEYAVDPTFAAQLAAFNQEIAAALAPPAFLAEMEAFLGGLSASSSGTTIVVAETPATPAT